MRRAVISIGGLAGCLLLTGLAGAQEKDATIKSPTAEVRGGRSEIFPITGYLRQGQTVRVVSEDGEFCAILPPAGSVNWIEDHAINPITPNGARRPDRAFVLLDNTTIRLGSDRVPKPLPYERAKLPRGTIVKIIGDKEFAEGKEWWPIQPPPSEVRYVAKSSLSPTTSTVVSASPAAPTVATSVSSISPTNPLWLQAQQAEAARDYGRAELLYKQLAGEMAQPGGDHDLAIRCYNRIEQLSRAQTGTWPARQPAPGMLVSGRSGAAAPPPTTVSASPPSISSGPGWLRRTGLLIDGQTAYVVEDNRGQRKYYVLGQQGLYPGLESYVNRPVEVYGPMVQRTDLAGGGYISVNRIQYLR